MDICWTCAALRSHGGVASPPVFDAERLPPVVLEAEEKESPLVFAALIGRRAEEVFLEEGVSPSAVALPPRPGEPTVLSHAGVAAPPKLSRC